MSDGATRTVDRQEKAPVYFHRLAAAPSGRYAYRVELACDHVNQLRPSWNNVVEADSLGPYEAYCPRCNRLVGIRYFVAVPWGKPRPGRVNARFIRNVALGEWIKFVLRSTFVRATEVGR